MSIQVDAKTSKHVRIDIGMHRLTKLYAADIGKTIKELVEDALLEKIPQNFIKKVAEPTIKNNVVQQ